MDDCIDGDDMDLENGNQVPQSPEANPEEEPRSPLYPETDSEIEMNTA